MCSSLSLSGTHESLAGLVLRLSTRDVPVADVVVAGGVILNQPRLFEAFSQEESGYTRRFDGSGMGLALANKYLELNGASLEVMSEKGRGSIFTIRFAKLQVRDGRTLATMKTRRFFITVKRPRTG